jgi:protein TonB
MIKNHLKYPELAELIGVNGRVNVGFVIDTSGHITNITPLNCIGAGCELEAVNVLSMSKPWQPGMQDNKLVCVQYTVPITFRANKPRVSFKELRRSKYGFVFEISGNNYNIDQAEQMLGKTFNSSQIEIAPPYTITDKFLELEGKDVYLIKVKSV